MKTDFEKFLISNNPSLRSVYDDYIKSYMNPYILEERELHVTQMDVFSRLMRDRIIIFNNEVNTETCGILRSQLLYLDNTEPGVDIDIHIDSPGGEVYSGLSVVDTMNFIESDVSTTCTGMAASMGSIFLTSGTKGKRFILPHSRVMCHQPLGGAKGQASDILIEAEEIQKIKKELYELISETTGQPYEKVWNDCERDHWFTASEAVEYGLCDKIITKKNHS